MHTPRPSVRAAHFFVACLCAVIVCASPASAQTPPGRMPLVSYSEAAGFGRWNVYALAQDTDGVLWIGGDAGIYRYDGHRFRSFPLPEGNSSSYIRFLGAGSHGDMWVLSAVGALWWHEGRWSAIDERATFRGVLERTALDASGRVWAVSSGGLFVETGPGRFEPVAGWPGGPASALSVEPSGDVYVAATGAIHHLDPNGRWEQWGPGAAVPSVRFNGIARDGVGRLWLYISFPTQLWLFDPSTGVVEERLAHVLDRGLTGAALAPQGTLWLAETSRVIRIDRGGDPRPVPWTPAGGAHSVLVDHEGSLWLGGHGIHRVAGRGLWEVTDSAEGLPSENVWAIRRDVAGQLWAATNKGLARATATGWTTELTAPQQLLRTILPDSDGALWLAGAGAVIFRYDPVSATLESFPLLGDGVLGPDQVFALAFDATHTLWAASIAGIFRADDARRMVRVPIPGVGDHTPFFDVLPDSRGRIWFAGDSGLSVLEGGTFRRFTPEDWLRDPASLVMIERADGEFCAATRRTPGVSCFRYNGKSIESVVHIDTSTGLTNDNVYLLGEDHAGRLWIGSGRGVDVVEGHRVIDHFGAASGLPSDDVNAGAFFAEPNGDVWIGTSSGLGRFLGAQYSGPPPPPPVIFTSARGGDADLLVPGVRRDLPYGRSFVEIGYAVPSYLDEVGITREARLVGATDETWHLDDDPLARFLGLPPGAYEFQARARRAPGEWGPLASLGFTILPPWWQMWWFRLSVALALVALIALAFRRRQRALRRRNEELEALVAERTHELCEAQARLVEIEKEATEQQMAGGFAHEVRNALVSVRVQLARAEGVRRGEPGLVEATQEGIKELYLSLRGIVPELERPSLATRVKALRAQVSALDALLRSTGAPLDRAFRLTQEILAYARLGNEASGRERVDLNELAIEILAERSTPGVEVEVAIPAGATLTGSPVHWRSILDNLVRNALDAIADQPTPSPRRLRIVAEVRAVEIELRVEDTGVGIAAEDLPQIFEPFFSTKPETGTGLGLGVVRKLVRLHGGTVAVESEPGKGTRFVLTVPTISRAPEVCP